MSCGILTKTSAQIAQVDELVPKPLWNNAGEGGILSSTANKCKRFAVAAFGEATGRERKVSTIQRIGLFLHGGLL